MPTVPSPVVCARNRATFPAATAVCATPTVDVVFVDCELITSRGVVIAVPPAFSPNPKIVPVPPATSSSDPFDGTDHGDRIEHGGAVPVAHDMASPDRCGRMSFERYHVLAVPVAMPSDQLFLPAPARFSYSTYSLSSAVPISETKTFFPPVPLVLSRAISVDENALLMLIVRDPIIVEPLPSSVNPKIVPVPPATSSSDAPVGTDHADVIVHGGGPPCAQVSAL
jgi:hypothetical protein